ncbi:MAG: hypothetical protein LBN10_03390 [Propionibacteriaceae bacterium]|jgi:hypothetical protein|nr:hypothetical protein [Propionibacteriaceae bacterium]
MSLNANNVRVAVTGEVYYDPTGALAAPTGTGSALTQWKGLGYNGESGVDLKMPGAGSPTSIKAWQDGAVVRVIRAAPDGTPQLIVTLIETKLETIELAFGVTVSQNDTDGSFIINTNTRRQPVPLVVDSIDAEELIRVYAPKAVVVSIDTISLNHDNAIGYALTFDLNNDATLGGQAKVWMTALKTPA